MTNWKKFSRAFLFTLLIVGLCAGLVVPRLDPVEAAPVQAPSDGDLSLTMTVPASDLFPNIGDNVIFTIKVTNNGTIPVTGITVKDIMPVDLTYQSDDGGGTYDSTTGIWAVGALSAGTTFQLKITAKVTATGPKTNFAEVWDSDQPDPNSTPANGLTSEDDYDEVVINPITSDLSLTKTVNDATPNKGDNIIFTITVSNTGPNQATSVTVKDVLPAGLTYVSDDGGGTYNDVTGIWAVGALLDSGAGSSDTLIIVAKVTDSGTITNSAEVWTSDQYDNDSIVANGSTTEDDYASVPIIPKIADLSITKSISDPMPNVSDTVTFTITVSNAGPNIATGVVVKDLLLSDYGFVSANPTSGSYDGVTGIWTVGAIANGSSETLTINATTTTNNVKTNWAEVWASDQLDPDSTPGDASQATDDDDGAPFADLSITKTASPETPTVGANVVFTTTINNAGPGNASGVQIKEVLPSGLTYVSDNGGGAYNNGTGLWSLGTLASGNSRELKVTAKVDTSGSMTNSAEVWTSNQYDSDSIPGDSLTSADDYASTTITSIYSSMTVVISEIAWAGTAANSNDEWVELYNPGSSPVNITGWQLTDGSTPIVLSGSIPARGYFLLETRELAVSVASNQFNSGLSLLNSGETLRLLDSSSKMIDSANLNGGSWPAGSSSTNGTMERIFVVSDSDSAWITNTGVVKNGTDANGGDIWGTPKQFSSPTQTPTATSTATQPPTKTPTRLPDLSLLINEVAWMGTSSINYSDEWIELYNPGSRDINLAGWKLVTSDSGLNFNLSGTIRAGGYLVFAHDEDVFTDLTINTSQVFSGYLNNYGISLMLKDPSNATIDIANSDFGYWPAGSSTTYGTMERYGKVADGTFSWVTYAGAIANPVHDRDGDVVKGTPGRANWAISVTITPTSAGTATRTSTPFRTPTPSLEGRLIINEFLVRPGYDWNQDGSVDVFDEFIEVKNIGNENINVRNWEIDDVEDAGSEPFQLPDLTLKPGQRVVYFGLQTNILLSDGGDTVRLIGPNGKEYDKVKYSVVKVEDHSTCRLPDGNGSWYMDCIPTPNLINTREGTIPSMPGGEAFESPVCSLPDTLPIDFLFAECRGYGAGIWRFMFWDAGGWQGYFIIPEDHGKWRSFLE